MKRTKDYINSDVWVRDLDTLIEFPQNCVFYLYWKTQDILVGVVPTKAQLHNIKWATIEPQPSLQFDHEQMAVLSVERMENATEVKKRYLDLLKIWFGTKEGEES